MRIKIEIISVFELRMIAHPPLDKSNYGTYLAMEETIRGYSDRRVSDDFVELIDKYLTPEGAPKQQYLFLDCDWENSSSLSSENYDEGWFLDIKESEDQVSEIPGRRKGAK